MPVYMKYGNDDIKGDVTAEGFVGQIELHSLQFGVGRSISTVSGSAKNREMSIPSISEISVTKTMDVSSIKLLQASLSAKEGKEVKLSFVRTDKDTPIVYCEYTLTNTIISSYSISSGGDTPSESLTLNFTKVAFMYDPGAETGKASQKATTSYDLATTKTA